MAIKYKFKVKDFEKAFGFAVNYYLDPTKSPSGRTTGEPRGLGAVLDAFTRGKLIEIGVQKMLESVNPRKRYVLDFDIKSISEVADEPDIIKIKEGGKTREPNLFVEIKSTSAGDHWIGLQRDIIKKMKNRSGGKKIFIIYSSIPPPPIIKTPKSADLVGMYLRRSIAKRSIFGRFAPLNAVAELEFVISLNDLENLGTKFPEGDMMYDTELFRGPISIRKLDGGLKSGIKLKKKYKSFRGRIAVPDRGGGLDRRVGCFNAKGAFNIYVKKNPKSKRNYIECLKDTVLENDAFGRFGLEKGSAYEFNLETLGRDPTLKVNNLFIAKRRIYHLIDRGDIQKPIKVFRKIAKEI